MNFGPESIFAWKQYQINNAVNTKSPRWEVNRRLRGHLGVCPGYCYRHLISCYLLTTTYYGNIRHSRLSREHGKVGATYEKSWQIPELLLLWYMVEQGRQPGTSTMQCLEIWKVHRGLRQLGSIVGRGDLVTASPDHEVQDAHRNKIWNPRNVYGQLEADGNIV